MDDALFPLSDEVQSCTLSFDLSSEQGCASSYYGFVIEFVFAPKVLLHRNQHASTFCEFT